MNVTFKNVKVATQHLFTPEVCFFVGISNPASSKDRIQIILSILGHSRNIQAHLEGNCVNMKVDLLPAIFNKLICMCLFYVYMTFDLWHQMITNLIFQFHKNSNLYYLTRKTIWELYILNNC